MTTRLKDIAEAVGVSANTVSKVLRNEGRIGAQTRQRILEYIRKVGYQPNFNARSLVTGRSFLVGLIVPDLMHPFFAAMAKALSQRLRERGYGVAISSSEEDAEIERREISTFLARSVDALILASSQRTSATSSFEAIEEARVPYVLADRNIPGVKAHFIGSDDVAIGVLATEHLIEKGYRRIAHIQLPEVSTGEGRLKGYRAALKRHGRTAPDEWIAAAESADEKGEECGYKAMQQLLKVKRRPDAVFCYNDVIGYGALKAIMDAKLKVPGDVAVIGVSNLASLSFWDASPVGLTTVDQNISALTEQTARLVLELIERGPRKKLERVILPATLVVRGST